ncbi:MAG TPA: amino acid ABC transporter substrate-binding protein [Rhodothermales bacterium]|nr:amino acid ABC transporter substrate-binding protein [Rhodothermales bacterium]
MSRTIYGVLLGARVTKRIALTLALALVVVACGSDDAGEETTTAPPTTTAPSEPSTTDSAEGEVSSDEPIRVGTSLTLTGIFAEFGSANQDGYQLCADEVNARGGLLDRPLELVIEDNRSDTEIAVSQYERFINVDRVDLLFGPFSSLLYFPTSSVAEQAGMVFPAPAGGALDIWERGYENIFYFQQNAGEFVGEAPLNALKHYRDIGVISPEDYPTTAAIVAVDDFFVNALVRGLVGDADIGPGAVADAEIEIVLNETFPIGFSEWLSLANQIAASGADVLLGGLTTGDEGIELMRALATVGYSPKAIYLSEAAALEFADNLGELANGVIAHTSWHPDVAFEGILGGEAFTNQDFFQRFQETFDREPGENEAQAFAVCQGIEQAVRGAGTVDNSAIRDWLRARTANDPVRTVMGDFYWDERGLPVDRDFLVGQWQDGRLNFVFPAEEFENVVDLMYPIATDE